jgi:protein-disulfide isomerase
MQVVPGWYKLGRDDAPVTMVEFMDLQCPACRRFQTATFAEIKKDYIDSGKLLFIARDLPLPMHPYALGAAEAAHCAGDQGKFWQFRDAVLDDHVPPTSDVLLKHARELGLNLQEFQNCLKDGKYKQAIQDDQADATTLGIHGAPGFVIGRTKGGWIEGLSMAGARPFPFFQQEIEKMLNESPSGLDGTSPLPVRNQ